MVHTALLDSLHTLDLPAPALTHLADVDDLYLMASVCRLAARF
ncbi:hypothetical protein AB0E01_14630 [Nocardia vinacea]